MLPAQNLVSNPGFENGFANWIPFASAPSAVSLVSSTNSYTGSNNLEVNLDSAADVFAGALQFITVVPGKRYELSMFIRTDSLNGMAFPYLNYIDTIVRFEYSLFPSNGTTPWRIVRARFLVPRNCTSLMLMLVANGKRGQAKFDEVLLEEVNLLQPPSFSIGLPTGDSIRTFSGTNAGPISYFNSLDLTQGFQELGIGAVRMHDFDYYCSVSSIFPDTTRSASDSTAYNFAPTDSAIAAILNSGAKVFFRLGERFRIPATYSKPADMQKWADVCVNIIRHYNAGWNNGFNYNIRDFEIWNEPDLSDFWNGTTQEYIELYRRTSRGIKQYDSTLRVGGPAIASIFDDAFLNEFLDSVSTYNLPFDFFSWHYYDFANPVDFLRADSLVNAKLAAYGLSQTPCILTEWSTTTFSPNNDLTLWYDHPYTGATTAAALINLEKTNLEEAYIYRSDEYIFAMFNPAGDFTRIGYGYKAISDFRNFPQQLSTTGSDDFGCAIAAAQQAYQDSIVIRAVIADHALTDSVYTFTFPLAAISDITIHRTDSAGRDSLVFTRSESGSGMMSIQVPARAPFVDVITIINYLTVGIAETQSGTAISVFPNPAANSLIVKTEALVQNAEHSISVTDASGRVVQMHKLQGANQHRIDISLLPSGLYLLHVSDGLQQAAVRVAV
ncbi:MAG: GH39 family glycosyl hydrolase, partial [Bacteroidia bacterium]